MATGGVCIPEPPARKPGAMVTIALPDGTIFIYHDVEILQHNAEEAYGEQEKEPGRLRIGAPDVIDHYRFALFGKAWPRQEDGEVFYWKKPGGPPPEKSGS